MKARRMLLVALSIALVGALVLGSSLMMRQRAGSNSRYVSAAPSYGDQVGGGSADGLFPGEQYGVGSAPISVVTADLNGDGHKDLVTANSMGNNVSVLLGYGDGTFTSQTTFDVGTYPNSVATGDLNADGHLDIVTANGESSDVSVLLGIGDATFSGSVAFAVGAYPVSVALGDLNEDTHLDIVTANNDSSDVSVLLGNGDGTFSGTVAAAVGQDPSSVSLGDVNGDDHLDIVTANNGSGDVSVLLGGGDGALAPTASYVAAGGLTCVALGDVNSDGQLDIAVCGSSSNVGHITLLLGMGNGVLSDAVSFGAGSFLTSMALRDVNGDGHQDIVAADLGGAWVGADPTLGSGAAVVLLGTGAGDFGAPASYSGGVCPWSVVVEDMDEDGRFDVLTANWSMLWGLMGMGSGTGKVTVLEGNGDGSFVAALTCVVGAASACAALGDVNSDGHLDAVVASNDLSGSGSVSVLLGEGDGGFAAPVAYAAGYQHVAVALGDVNEDGSLDIVTSSIEGDVSTAVVLIGNGDGSLGAPVTYAIGTGGSTPLGIGLSVVTLGDVNNDDHLDIVASCYGADGVKVLLGNGGGSFAGPLSYSVGSSLLYAMLGDVNDDGWLDIVASGGSDSGGQVVVLLGAGDGGFGTELSYAVTYLPLGVALGDVNGDGYPDIVVDTLDMAGIIGGGSLAGNVMVLLGRGDGSFAEPDIYDTGYLPVVPVLGDVDGDGSLDILSSNLLTGDVAVLPGNGDGTFDAPASYATGGIGYPASFAVLGDVNEDNLLDVVVSNGLGGVVSVLLNQYDVVWHDPRGGVADSVGAVQFHFPAEMDTSSFSFADDLVGFTGPLGSLTATGYRWIDPRTLEVTFDPQRTAGAYEMVIGPEVLDVAGNAMNQDGDRVAGEIPDDRYAATFSLVGLYEASSTESVLFERVLVRKATLSDGAATGDLGGTVDLTGFEIVTVNSGAFSGKGFSMGDWTASLEGASFSGYWKGVAYAVPGESKICLKGTLAGGATGVMEGSLAESVEGSGIYDQYSGTWKLGRLGSIATSATLTVDGVLSYAESTEHPSTEIHALQSVAQGTTLGDYNESIGAVLTHLGIASQDNPYYGHGFSILSYTSDHGSGDGWTCDRTVSPGLIRLDGLLDGPLSGGVSGTLGEIRAPRVLTLRTYKTDLGLAPAAEVVLNSWGPGRVSPGETVNYLIECRNDGLSPAGDVAVSCMLDPLAEYISASDDPYMLNTSIRWELGTLAPEETRLVTVTVRVPWGLPSGTAICHEIRVKYLHGRCSSGGLNITANGIDHSASNPVGVLVWNRLSSQLRAAQIPGLYDSGSVSQDVFDVEAATPYYREVRYDETTGIALIYDAAEDSWVPATTNDYFQAVVQTPDGDRAMMFKPTVNNGLSYLKAQGGEIDCDTLFAYSGGTRTVVTAILAGYVNCRTLVLLSPMAGGQLFNPGGWLDEMRWLRATYPAMEIVIYQSQTDRLPAGGLYQAKFNASNQGDMDWLEANKVIVNPGTTEFSWAKDADGNTMPFPPLNIDDLVLEVDEDINAQGHTEMPGYVVDHLTKEASSRTCSQVAVARDPNVKYGPQGPVMPGQRLNYRVEFENEGEGIAFGVYFTDSIDEDLDAATLDIGPVVSSVDGSVIGTPGTYNPSTRTITWLVGTVGSAEGGYADMSASVRSDALDGTEIINFATVYFPSVPETTRTNGIVSTVGLNQPPVAEAGGPYDVNEGATVVLDASGSSDPDGDALQYRWDFNNDGIWDTDWSNSPTASYAWEDEYEGAAAVEVSDGQSSATGSCSITIRNAAPMVEAGPDGLVSEGDAFSSSGTFGDPGADAWGATVDYGDGAGPQSLMLTDRAFTLSHAYADNGTYAVAVVVTDNDGGVGSDTVQVTVTNVEPTVGPIAVPVDPVAVGTSVSASASFSDPGPLDTHTAAWDWGDGSDLAPGRVTESGGSGTASGSHTYTAPGLYTITLTVADLDGGSGHATATVVVVVPATINFDPDTLNLKSKGNYVTVYIELPAGYNVGQIAISSILLNGTVSALSKPTAIGDYDKDGVPDLMVKFDRAAVQGILSPGDQVQIAITGQVGGLAFEGSDTIRVIR